MKKAKKLLILLLVFLTVFMLCSIAVSALNWNGTAVKGVGASNAQGAAGYTIRLVGNDGCFGYRFSVVDASGNTKSKSGYPTAIDVYRDISLDSVLNKVYNSYNSATVKYNKKQLITNRSSVNLSMSAIKNQSNSFLSSSMGFATALPAPSGVEEWQKKSANIDKVLAKLGQGSAGNFVYGDRLLIEPLFVMQIKGGNYNAMTATEIALYGAAFYSDSSSNGGASSNTGSWGYVASYTNMYFPRSLFTANSTMLGNLWGAGSNLTSKTSFENIITKGYGIGIAYSNFSSYTVTLKKGTGINTVTGAGTYKVDDSVKISATLKNGYQWKNWTGTKPSTTKNYTFTMPSSNVTNTANATAISYTITHDPNGGSWSGDNAKDVRNYTIEDCVPILVAPTRTGYSFAGWKVTSANGNWTLNKVYTVSSSAIYLSNMYGNVTLTAQWTPNKYTITHNPNGGTWNGDGKNDVRQYSNNGSVSILIAPSRTGYTFSGWKVTSASGNWTLNKVYTVSSSVINLSNMYGDVTLTAQWTPIKYTVAYNANGGSGAPSSHTKTHGVNLTLSSTKPTRTGYTFNGWNTNSSGTGTNYASGGTYSSNANVTLYAKWMPNTLTICYDCYGANATVSDSSKGFYFGTYNRICTTSSSQAHKTVAGTANVYYQSFSYNSPIGGNGLHNFSTFGLSTPTGYKFSGWKCGSKVFDEKTITYKPTDFTSDINNGDTYIWLTAQFTPVNYTVTYNANGGSGAPSAQTKAHGVDLTLSSAKPTRTGYTFSKWNTKADGTGTSYNSGAKYTGNANLTLYAQWNPIKYTMRYETAGGIINSSSYTISYTINDSVTIPNASKTGYTFDGWRITKTDGNWTNTSKNYQPQTWKAGESYGSPTLTAQWTPVTYTVKYNANGGSGAPANQTKTYGVNLTLSSMKPTRAGYTFNGWNTNSSGTGTNYASGGIYSSNANITLYAKWTPLTYTVAYNANGGNGAPFAQIKTYGVDLTLSSTKPTRTGYTFVKWNTKADGTGTSYNSGAKYTGNAHLTLYAQWNPIKYTIRYETAGGTINPSSYTISYTINDSVTIPNASKTGYTFNGWRITKTDGNWTNTSKNYQPQTWKVGESYGSPTLSAQWTPVTYTVKYNANGGSGAPANQNKTYGVDLTLSSTKPTRTGYTFVKWNTKSDGTGTSYNPSGKYTNNANLTLYAQWEAERTLSLEAITPNASYRENTEVITSFNLVNNGTKNCIPSDNVSVVFKVYKDDSVIKTVTKERVVVPANDKNLLYFKWKVPENLDSSTISISGEIVENGSSYGLVKRSYSTCKYTISSTPDTQYEISAPSGFTRPNTPATSNGTKTWSVYSYENGTFKKTNYGIGFSNDTPKITPASSANASLSNGIWTMKSGYGIEMSFTNGVKSVSGYVMPDGGSYTLSQYAIAQFPEFSYDTSLNKYRTLELVSGKWIFRQNGSYGRLHFTPLWYPDGNYTVAVEQSDLWTPAGMITRKVNTNSIVIKGSAYDDWYVS